MSGFESVFSSGLAAEYWLAGLAALLVGLSKGGLPAIGMLAVPILSLAMSPVVATVMLLPIYIMSDVIAVWLYRRDFSAVNLRILIPAGVLGVAIGWFTASMVSDRAITLMIGLLGVAFCLNVWLRNTALHPAKPVHRGKGWFWGAMSGFTSFISHAGGPPFQIYILPQKLPKTEFAGTATILFAVINLAKVIPYQNLRPYSAQTLHTAFALVPFSLVGAVAGAWMTRHMADVWFYRIVQISLFCVSLKLCADALRSFL